MKQILFIALMSCCFGAVYAQSNYYTYVVLPPYAAGGFADSMEGKRNLSGAGFIVFSSFDDANGNRVCDSSLQTSFSPQFASLLAWGWSPIYVYDGCYDMPACYDYNTLKLNQKMFNLQAAIAASRTVSIVLHDTTYTKPLSANILFTLKIPVPYSGVTNASGDYTIVFATPYSVAPNIQAGIVGATTGREITKIVSTTGFTVHAYDGGGAIEGANIDVIITEK